MLHVRLRGRQVPGWLLATLAIALLAATPITPARAARADDLAAAESLVSEGRHAEAAAAYESLGKRRFRGWDARLALLSAREYLLAGRLDDAERLLAFASPAESRDDTILLARVSALTGEASLRANLALLDNNARVAAEIAGVLGQAQPVEMLPSCPTMAWNGNDGI